MPVTLSTSEFEQSRKLVDITLTVDQLPDAVLAADAYAGEAVRWVSARTSNTDENAKAAAVYVLAALVMPAVPKLLSESNAGYSYSQQQTNVDKRVAQLLAMAEDAIARSEAANPTDVGTAYLDGTTITQFDVAPAGWPHLQWWEKRYPSA